MFLGIEIGGTKLQLGIGDGCGGQLTTLERADIVPEQGAAGILEQIRQLGTDLLTDQSLQGVGIGFGGPVDVQQGRVITSHQIGGWENFYLADWSRQMFGLPTVVGNDCDCATLAEAQFGAGEGRRSVFYVTVGTGVGGGFVKDGQLLTAGRPAAGEIGHLRPGLQADQPDATVESLASGWGIAMAAQDRITGKATRRFLTIPAGDVALKNVDVQRRLADAREADEQDAADLLHRCDGDVDQLTAQLVGDAARQGNLLALSVLKHACQVLGWAIAQTITLLAPEVIVIGGGVSLLGDELFMSPVRREVARYVFPALADSYTVQPAALGESVVVQGALLLAAREKHD